MCYNRNPVGKETADMSKEPPSDPRELAARDAEMYRLADISTALLDESGEFIHAMPYPARSYNERTPLMHEIRAEGIDL